MGQKRAIDKFITNH